ncbi:isoprenoid biosynthesis glyoxalase ElbB [Balneatrix alpica]|uniref:Glyoxalase n=1 Tax=Balneatrix alpica TaxID=75684 RepID=A0ABV5ZAZ7_9GAMM|nr:isoprenoid biosynthesis glyoxalase ElbB [Balneatrix alpica]
MKVAVILSGCGVFDGAEIHESVLTLLALEQAGCQYQCLAPDRPQAQVINHLTGEAMTESRNVLVEAARIARGQIQSLANARAEDYDAVILPGGFGAAKNLCDFAFKGSDCEVLPEVLDFCQAIAAQAKPLGFICIAPAMIPRIFGPGSRLTIGTDADTAAAIEQMGGQHQSCPVSEFVVDEQHKVVSTPAYMLANSISEAASGINRLVQEVVRLARR